MYPTGASVLLGPMTWTPLRPIQNTEGPPQQNRTVFTGRQAPRYHPGADTAANAAIEDDARVLENDWEIIRGFISERCPGPFFSPCVSPGPDDKPFRSQFESHGERADDVTNVPRFLPFEGGQVVGFLSGRQTHSLVAFSIDKSVVGQKIDLFGFTFDHPEISDALVRAALRGVVVRLTLNAEEVEGKSKTAHAKPMIDDMMRRTHGRALEVWKQQGQRCAPVYASWKRPWHQEDTKRGPLHAKVFVRGPVRSLPAESNERLVVMGSPNWTISSECNAELAVALRFGNEGAAEVDLVVQDLRLGATPVTLETSQQFCAAGTGRGNQFRTPRYSGHMR